MTHPGIQIFLDAICIYIFYYIVLKLVIWWVFSLQMKYRLHFLFILNKLRMLSTKFCDNRNGSSAENVLRLLITINKQTYNNLLIKTLLLHFVYH